MEAEVVAVASLSAGFPYGRAATAGPFRVFVQDGTIYVSLSMTGCFFGHPKAPEYSYPKGIDPIPITVQSARRVPRRPHVPFLSPAQTFFLTR
jgi:hypothetical protein